MLGGESFLFFCFFFSSPLFSPISLSLKKKTKFSHIPNTPAKSLSGSGSVAVAARRYSTDSDAVLAAVQQLAGPATGNSLVDSTKLAVNSLKVITALQAISEDLKQLTASGKLEPSTLRSLSAYLTLQSAAEKFGFDASKYGLSGAQAADIAAVFSEFDANSDGRLELSELRRLCALVGRELSEDELKEGIKLLGQAQYIYFNDFVEWYLGMRPAKRDAAA